MESNRIIRRYCDISVLDYYQTNVERFPVFDLRADPTSIQNKVLVGYQGW